MSSRGAWPCHPATYSISSMSLEKNCLRNSIFAVQNSFLGLPYNTASLALLTHMLAQQCDLTPGEIVITTGDSHIYTNHQQQVATQLTREPRPLPQLVIKRRPATIYDYQFEDFELLNYQPHPHIAAPVAV